MGMSLGSAMTDMRMHCVSVDPPATRWGAGGFASNCKVHGKVTGGVASAPLLQGRRHPAVQVRELLVPLQVPPSAGGG